MFIEHGSHYRLDKAKKKCRVGRGAASGLGKTCGRGTKGQKARTGVSVYAFEGGQNPLYTCLPKRGFVNVCAPDNVSVINLKLIDAMMRNGLLQSIKVVDINWLRTMGLIEKKHRKVKLIGAFSDGCAANIEFIVNAVSKGARASIESIGSLVKFC